MELKSNNFMDVDVSHGGKIDFIFGLLYWGYWSKTCKYVTKKTFETHCLFQNLLHGFAWVVKLQTKFELKLGSLDYKIDGCFRHKNCKRLSTFCEPFANLTCVACFQIPQEPKF